MSQRLLALGAVLLFVLLAAIALVISGSHSKAPRHGLARAGNGLIGQASRSPRALATASFVTSYPAGWTISSARAGEARRYQLSSTGAPIDSAGIGAAGTVGVTIVEVGLRGQAAASIKGARTSTADLELLRRAVGVPRAATGVSEPQAPRPTSLGGVPAVEESFFYTYAGRPNVQSDVLALHDTRAVLIELDGEPNAAALQEHAYEKLLLGNWRWR